LNRFKDCLTGLGFSYDAILEGLAKYVEAFCFIIILLPKVSKNMFYF